MSLSHDLKSSRSKKLQQRAAGPLRGYFGENLESAFVHIFKDNKDAAVAFQFVQPLILERLARNFGEPDCSVIVELH